MMTPGGGFNAMVAAQRLNAPVTYGGTIGTGPLADLAANALKERQIAIAMPQRAPIDQGSCVVLVHPNGERSFITHHGAERRFERQHLSSLDTSRFAYALLSGYSLYKAESARVMGPWLAGLQNPPLLVFDPGPVVSEIPKDVLEPVLRRADWISANLNEAQSLSGTSNAEEAAMLLGKGRSGALVRVGVDGCWLASAAGVRHVAGFAVHAIDSNGAGDTHDGAFIAALIAGVAPEQAAVIANAAAALSTTMLGPATAPEWAAVATLLKSTGRADALPTNIGLCNRGS